MKRIVLSAVVVLLACAASNLFASAVVNGVGFGSVSTAAWCPGGPPALPSNTAGMAGVFGATSTSGCAGGTFITGTNGAFWNTVWAWAANGGNSVAGDYTKALPLFPALSLPYTTSGSLDVTGSVIDANDALFTGTYSLSNSGSGFTIEWLSDSTDALLASMTETVGAASGSINMTVFDPMGYADIDMETDIAAQTATPEPASLFLLGSGLLSIAATARKRRRA